MAERSKDWLDQAKRDLDHARHDLDDAFYEWACFSAQQAADKAVKAVFQRLGAEAWGHSISDLLLALDEREHVPSDIAIAAAELDKAYVATRYPDAHPSGSPGSRYVETEADRMVEYADRILRFCTDLLAAL
ncbi:MAG TPA: HEPN domain-containing protein [Chloroflexota bacterium]|nr:HEPN domain-containing protein [Chloroflexota bacterium]